MTKSTQQDVLACNDEQQLNEWVAVYCMGWALKDASHLRGYQGRMCWFNGFQPMLTKSEYNPCQNKSLAFDLMINFEVTLKQLTKNLYSVEAPFIGSHEIYSALIAITKAAICAALDQEQGESKPWK